MEEEDIMAVCFPSLDSAKEHAGHFAKKVMLTVLSAWFK